MPNGPVAIGLVFGEKRKDSGSGFHLAYAGTGTAIGARYGIFGQSTVS